MKLFVLFFVPIFLCHASAWEKVKEQDGIEVYSKISTGENSIISFKGNGVVKAPLELVATVVFDIDRAGKLSDALISTTIVRWISHPHHFIEYNEIDMPLFLDSRDFISEVKITYNKDEQSIQASYQASKDSRDQTPRKKGNILGSVQNSFFKMTSLNEGKETQLEGAVWADPKGMIPIWLVNLFQEDWPYDTIMAVRREVKKRQEISPFVQSILK